ncbi:MAG: hypothetical protein KDC38_17115 [Planctomycetes bacterium]|nr:hypothetical protein [Planctomycetota bacterium]
MSDGETAPTRPPGVLAERDALERRSRRLGALRVSLFAIMVAGSLVALGRPAIGFSIALPALVLFPLLIVLHHRVDVRRRRLSGEILLAEEEAARRDGNPRHSVAPVAPGLDDRDEDASIQQLDSITADDLGLLRGSRSLFGLVDTTSTWFGAKRLSEILTRPLLSSSAIHRRQAAIRECAERDDVRRRLLQSLLPLRSVKLDRLATALDGDFEWAERRGIERWAHLVGTLLPLCLGLAIGRPELLIVVVVLFFASMSTITSNSSRSNPARDRLCLLGPVVRALLQLDESLAEESLRSDEWTETHRKLRDGRVALERLDRRVRWLEWHAFGIVFEGFNLVSMWELRWLPSAERLVLEHRGELREALAALGHTEALLSLAALTAERDDFDWPEIVDAERPFIEAESVGHPTLDPGQRVENPLAIGVPASTVAITGSNMAGKSTYLRTIGANVVLASIGAPVCGRGFRMTPVEIYTDVNIRDSLDDGKSYFQVEVERVRDAVRATERTPFVLALFDELFRGTNARERFAISWSLVEAITRRGALLIVATHDNRLAERIEASSEPELANIHFREHVVGDELRFDYRLRQGPATTRNAIRVLEVSGYDAAIVARARAVIDEVDGSPESES